MNGKKSLKIKILINLYNIIVVDQYYRTVDCRMATVVIVKEIILKIAQLVIETQSLKKYRMNFVE